MDAVGLLSAQMMANHAETIRRLEILDQRMQTANGRTSKNEAAIEALKPLKDGAGVGALIHKPWFPWLVLALFLEAGGRITGTILSGLVGLLTKPH